MCLWQCLFCILNWCAQLHNAHVVVDRNSIKFIFSSHSRFLLILFLGGCRQPVTRSSICSWTPPLFSHSHRWRPGTRTPCTDAASATQLGSPTYSPSWVLVGHLVPSEGDHESRNRTFWPTSNLLVTIFDEKAEKRLRRKSAVPVLVPVPQPGAEVDGAAPVLLTEPLSS